MDRFLRTEMVLGKEAMIKLSNSRIIVFGVGGVGGFVVEGLARSGVRYIDVVDNDTVSITNINRQLIALTSTIGKPKVEVIKDRILDINPSCVVNTYNQYYDKDNMIDISNYDYVIDCIDTVTSKLLLISEAKRLNVNIISSMGTGNKIDPSKLMITDLSKTSVCPLARVMRYELRKRGITSLKVLFSNEEPKKVTIDEKRHIPGSVSFVPSVAGLMIAGYVINDLIK